MCDYNGEGVETPDCQASTTVRQVCQDEVYLKITTASNDHELASALSFEPGIYYLILLSEFLCDWMMSINRCQFGIDLAET